jgi:hypothetical protein
MKQNHLPPPVTGTGSPDYYTDIKRGNVLTHICATHNSSLGSAWSSNTTKVITPLWNKRTFALIRETMENISQAGLTAEKCKKEDGKWTLHKNGKN